MRRHLPAAREVLSAWFCTLFCFCAISQSTSAPPAAPDANAVWQRNLADWRSQREHSINAPDGSLSLIALEWLKPGFNSFGSAQDNVIHLPASAPPHLGMFTILGKTPAATVVQLLSPPSGFPADFTIDGVPAREGVLAISEAKPSVMAWHSLSMVILQRGDHFVLRIKDADSPSRAAFRGLHWYAPNPDYRVTARWVPFNPPRVEKIPTVLGTTLDMVAPGATEFLLKGKVYLLEPVIEGNDHTHLFFILRDDTSTSSTYASGRFLTTGIPDHGLNQPGAITLDFNQLYNPPCAYTTFATCPLPPEQNRLPVAIEAGEQRYTP
ncbi:MAG TPA: DUF1684 domain-containing protein [Terracidiphilus sp.]|jgi:uncharacterized protein (DUF1684 family)|nr:DUF1684 domain-containing protein [Terracidiphilus sp.]